MRLIGRNRVRDWLIIIVLSVAIPASGQYENIWVPPGINFNSGSPLPEAVAGMFFGEASAMICDADGVFMMATNGDEVWDKNYDLMPNGLDLLPVPGFPDPTQSTLQGTVIVPIPGSVSKYYIFSLTALTGGATSMPGHLYYSIVDINLNGGLGDVEPDNKGVFIASGYIEGITAVTGDRCNIWLLARSDNGSLHAYEITENGLSMDPTVSPIIIPGTGIGYIKAAPDRKKLMVADINYRLMDFDAGTGIVSNIMTLLPVGNFQLAYTVPEFSPNSMKLYAYDPVADSCFQFDLTAGSGSAIYGSRIALIEGKPNFKLGPDDKIYFGRNNRMDRINQPNQTGLACDIQTDVIPGNEHFSFLYNPNVVAVIHRDTFLTSQPLSAGCFAGQAIIAANNDTTGWDYQWNTGELAETLAVLAPGSYWVSYHTPPCVFNVDTFHVTFPNGVLPAIQIDTACAGAANGGAYATTYPGDTVHYTYIWLNGTDTLSFSDTLSSTPSGGYTLLVHTLNCDTTLNFVIPEVDHRVNFIISDTLLCMGAALQVHNISDAHFSQFAWYFGDGDSSVVANPSEHVYAHAGSYQILLRGSGTICTDTARSSLWVDSMFSAMFNVDQREVCVGDAIHFGLQGADVSFTALQWDWGDDSYLDAAYENSFYHAFDRVGTFPVQVTLNSRVCPDTFFTDTVQAYALPEVNLGGDTSLCLDGSAVVLHNLATSPIEPYHYLWSTGDTTAGLRVLQPGRYSLRITTTPIGCNATDVIEIAKDCYTDVPNAFTPNGDGENDYFFPRTQLSKNVDDFKMQVFNRWGQLVFETRTIDGRGWDGRFNANEQPMGVYIYLVDVVYVNGRQERYEGNVTLVR